jgi:oxalate---CoA ligase
VTKIEWRAIDRYASTRIAEGELDVPRYDRLAPESIEAMSAASWQTVAEMLEMNASRFGSRAALLAANGDVVTHRELFGRVDSVSAWLGELGIRAGDRVAIALPQGVELAVVLLGVSAAGLVAVPLDLQDSHRGLLERLKPALLIADEGATCLSAAGELGIRVVGLDDLARTGDSDLNLKNAGWRSPLADDVAFVLHTSGTSAVPKRVPLSHANVCASATRIAAALELSAGDRCLIAMPLFHGHGLVATLLPALAVGGSCICLPGFDAGEIAGKFAVGGVTWFTGVPAMYRALVEHVVEPVRGTSLRFLRTASAAMPGALMEEIERTFGVPLIQAYGMTEAAGIASNPLPPRARKPGSAGLPVGAEVAILDEDGRAVTAPDGIGDVAIRGPIVTAGYENDAVAKEDNAVANAAFRDGWFFTGDRGRVDGDGYLFLLGRGGEVINRGGEKIGAVEIDEVLAGHPAIREAAAFGAPHASLGEDLVAAVPLRSGIPCTEQEVRDYMLARCRWGRCLAGSFLWINCRGMRWGRCSGICWRRVWILMWRRPARTRRRERSVRRRWRRFSRRC